MNNNTAEQRNRKAGFYWVKLGGCWRIGSYYRTMDSWTFAGLEAQFADTELDEIDETLIKRAEATPSSSTEAIEIEFAQWVEQERKWYLGKHPYQEGKYLYRGETKTLEDLYQVFKNKRTI
jgi:hypothetical protein